MTHEIRVDPLTGLRVIVAGDRPLGAAPVPAPVADVPLPPVVRADAPVPEPDGRPLLFVAEPAAGVSETLPHGGTLLELGEAGLAAAMEVWRDRMSAHREAACRHLVVDESPGGPPRAQLHALPFVPAAIARERERYTSYATQTMGGDLLQDLLQEEVRRRERLVAYDDDAVLLAPYASRVPYQLMIVPRTGRARFEDAGPLGAGMLASALTRLAAVLGGLPPLTLWVRTEPRDAERFCWRIDLLPRVQDLGGLELGSGLGLNPLPPEQAATALRAVS